MPLPFRFPLFFATKPQKRFFDVSGTFYVPNGVTRLYITCVPAGGGGGGGGAGSNRWGNNGGSPGGGGGYANNIIRQIVNVLPNHTYNVTLGAGGIYREIVYPTLKLAEVVTQSHRRKAHKRAVLDIAVRGRLRVDVAVVLVCKSLA
jgi:hypothetical protein